MFKKIILLLIFSLFLCSTSLFCQTYATGAIFDQEKYNQVDLKPSLITRNYTTLPRVVSLRHYSPIPESQGAYGTCVGWATSFASRTISESIALNRIDQRLSGNNAFSPLETYLTCYVLLNRIPRGYENTSFLSILNHLRLIQEEGLSVSTALNYLKNTGAVKRPEAERSNLQLIFLASYLNIRRYPIADYTRLFPYNVTNPLQERVLPVKKSLSEEKPVVIAMITPASFHSAKDVWKPYESPTGGNHGAHAMCVIGYDDNKYGGAFEVQNSWGTNWGNNGYIWIRYDDFAKFVYEAYDLIENLALFKEATKFATSIEIELFNNRAGMPVTYDSQGFYKTRSSYPSGTDFRFLITNKHSAYVYAFAADTNTPTVTRIFPQQGVSPVMDYKDSTIAWPGEFQWIKLDNTTGTDYLVVLYSKEALDINAIEQRFARETGVFPERVARAVGQNFIPYKDIKYTKDKIEFSAETYNPKSVFGLLLAIDHHTR